MSPPTRKKFRWGIVVLTRLKRYEDLETGLRIKRTNRKCRIPVDQYLCRVDEKLIMRKSEEEEDEEEEEEEEKEESKKKGSNEASKIGSNYESSCYAASDKEVESDLESTTRSEPKCNEMEDTCESGVRHKTDSS
ncbi:hypothetical protein Tco_1213947 [Tanacetum coccineum]